MTAPASTRGSAKCGSNGLASGGRRGNSSRKSSSCALVYRNNRLVLIVDSEVLSVVLKLRMVLRKVSVCIICYEPMTGRKIKKNNYSSEIDIGINI